MDGATCAGPTFYPFFSLEFQKSGADIDHIMRSYFQGKIVKWMDLDGSLNGRWVTSFLQEVQVIDDLVKPINLFSISSSGLSNLAELERSTLFCLFRAL